MTFLKDKQLWLGLACALVALFVYELLSGQTARNTSVFNPDSYA